MTSLPTLQSSNNVKKITILVSNKNMKTIQIKLKTINQAYRITVKFKKTLPKIQQ